MHETALAKRIVAEVLARAGGARVRSVRGEVCEDEALGRDALLFHFRAHARGTVAEAAELELTLRHLSARCRRCDAQFLPDHHLRICPGCGAADALLEGEPGVRIDEIVVEEP